MIHTPVSANVNANMNANVNAKTAMNFKRIALKLSGEALKGEALKGEALKDEVLRGEAFDNDTASFNIPFIEKFVANIIACASQYEIVLIVGGGNFFRGKESEKLNISSVKADQMGMLATIMNGLLLKEIFTQQGQKATVMSNVFCPSICDVFQVDRANSLLKEGHVLICVGGTSVPCFTTDTAVVLKAFELNCQLIMKATKVKGIFSQDPIKYPKAQFYQKLSFDEVISQGLNVMDQTAFEMARSHHIPIVVFSVLEALEDVLKGKCEFTLVS